MASVSITGSGHFVDQDMCQDAFRTNFGQLCDPRAALSPPAPLILTAADGLGSAANSAVGSTLATALGLMVAQSTLAGTDWSTVTASSLLSDVRAVVDEAVACTRNAFHALEHHAARSTFGTTFMLAVLFPPWLFGANIGDGFVVLERRDGGIHLVAPPYIDRENASATATLLSGSHLVDDAVFCVLDPEIVGVALSTDGLDDLALDYSSRRTPSAHRGFFEPLFSDVRNGELDSAGLQRWAISQRIRERTEDDITLAVAARRSVTIPSGSRLVGDDHERVVRSDDEQRGSRGSGTTDIRAGRHGMG
jgi:Protein phosphatase 2C